MGEAAPEDVEVHVDEVGIHSRQIAIGRDETSVKCEHNMCESCKQLV